MRPRTSRPLAIALAAAAFLAAPLAPFASRSPLSAETLAPALTVEAGFDFTGFDPATASDQNGAWLADGSDRWYSAENARVGLTARWGSALSLEARLDAPFDSEATLTADSLLRELAIGWNAGDILVLTAGKQNLKWGTARVFSAVDSLSPALDPLNPEKTDRGVTGLRADIIPSWWFSFATVALPASVLDRSTLGIRAEILAGETDLSFGAVRSTDSAGDETPALFADFARFFDRFGAYGEVQVKWPGSGEADGNASAGESEPRKTFTEPFAGTPRLSATAGLQIDIPAWLDGTLTLLGEYRYQEDTAWLPDSLDSENEHALYVGLSGIPLTRRATARAYALSAPNAEQTLAGASLSWSPEQSMTVSLGYEYLIAKASPGDALIPYLSANRHRATAGVTVWY